MRGDEEWQREQQRSLTEGRRGMVCEAQQDDDETDIQIVHITIGPREFIGEMDMWKVACLYGDSGELRLQNAVMVLYKDVGVEGEKVKTLLLNLQEKLRYTGEVIIYPGEAHTVVLMPLDEKGQLYKDYKNLFSNIIQPTGANVIPGPRTIPPYPHGN